MRRVVQQALLQLRWRMLVLSLAQVMKEDDASWPAPDRVGRQELEVVMGNEHISFATTKLGSLLQVGCLACWRVKRGRGWP